MEPDKVLTAGTARVPKNASTPKPDLSPLVFNPAAGRLPPPEAMAAYAAIDPSYPDFLKEIFSAELKRNYQYQLVALIAGWSFGAILLCGSVFLAYTDHPKMALSLIGANILGLATRMLTKSVTRGN